MEIPAHLDPTIVTANGTIIHIGKANDGLIVVCEGDHKPVMSFDEVSDDEIVNVFVKFAPGAAFGEIDSTEGESARESHIVGSDGTRNTHEILIRRRDHQPLTKSQP